MGEGRCWGGGGGGDSNKKQMRMLLLRSVNFRFWPRLEFSELSANILCRQGLV